MKSWGVLAKNLLIVVSWAFKESRLVFVACLCVGLQGLCVLRERYASWYEVIRFAGALCVLVWGYAYCGAFMRVGLAFCVLSGIYAEWVSICAFIN